jgi:hypothetical protein
MEAEFIIDEGHCGMLTVSAWLEGEPETGFWAGLKTSHRDRCGAVTYRR